MATIIARLHDEDYYDIFCECSSSRFTKTELINKVNDDLTIVKRYADEFIAYLSDNGYKGSYEEFYGYDGLIVYYRLKAILSLSNISTKYIQPDVVSDIWDCLGDEDEL